MFAINFLSFIALLLITVTAIPLNPANQENGRNKNHEKNTIFKYMKETFQNVKPSTECELCYIALPLVRDLILANKTKGFKEISTLVCVALKIYGGDIQVCEQAIGEFEYSVLDVIIDTALTDSELCMAVIGCSKTINNPAFSWNITLPDVHKPPVAPPRPPLDSAPKLKVLHLTDLHIDYEYAPGSLADCDQPLCCRISSTSKNQTVDPKRLAGIWGDYRKCDLPVWTLENMFEYISKNEEFDMIYWTGDLPPHNVWNQSRNDQLTALESLTTLFRKYFPNISILPSIGNHEATPANLFPTPLVKEDNITWLYTELAKDWSQTGLPISLKSDIINGAFYTLSIYPGFRVISLNMNYCPNLNFWLYINSTDPLGQLDWLAKTLQKSEDIGEKVHILGHYPPSNCLSSWKNNYYRIVNRYESTITGQFFGHTHNDQFYVMYDIENPDRAIGMEYVTGSATTYSFLNPGYRIYTIDGNYNESSYDVLDYRNVFLNLTEANLFQTPTWRNEYTAKTDFDMKNLYPADWDDLLNRMLLDLDGPLVDKFLRFYSKMADIPYNCDKKCRKDFVCGNKFYSRPFSC